jgi:hypothetical protein
MPEGPVRSSMVALASALALLCLAPNCLAATPIAGGRYAGTTSSGDFVAFNVDDRRQAFVSNPRIVYQGSEIDAPCATRPWDLGGSRRRDAAGKQTTLSNGKAARIRAGGTFGLSASADDSGTRASLKLTGRFSGSGKRANASFTVSGSSGQGPCTRRGTFVAKFTGQRHLGRGACPPSGSTSIVNDGVRRVYEEPYVYDQVVRNSDGGYGPGGAIYGCEGRSGGQWFLAGDDSNQALAHYYGCGENFEGVVVSGDVAALSLGELCRQPGVVQAWGRVVNLHTGIVMADASGTVGAFPPTPTDGSLIQRGLIAANGSIAWIACTVFAQPRVCQVDAAPANGSAAVLDQGEGIDPLSLTLQGLTVSWQNNGATKTAPMP